MAESRLMQVLLVDNDGVNRYTIRKVLQRVGYIVAEASYADEALDLLERQHFDLVLSEIHLPGTDGIDLLQRCKARSTRCSCRLNDRTSQRGNGGQCTAVWRARLPD